jgi:hypothetical protein
MLVVSAENVDWGVSLQAALPYVFLSLIVASAGWFLAPRFAAIGFSRGAATLLWVIFWLWFGPFVQGLRSITGTSGIDAYAYGFPIWILGMGLGGIILAGMNTSSRWTQPLNLFSAFILIFPIAGLLRGTSNSLPEAQYGLPARPNAQPSSPPDIYFLILDEYAGTQSLEKFWNYNNRAFEESLRQRDFFIPVHAHANYVHTHLSVASMLNWTHLLDLHDTAGDGDDRSYTYDMIENNRAARFLKSIGYTFVFFPTTFPGTQWNRLADQQIPEPPLRRTNFFPIWLTQTPVAGFVQFTCTIIGCEPKRFPYPPETVAEFKAKFTEIAEQAEKAGPKLVLAHVLLPHPPFIFRADCAAREPFWPRKGDREAWPRGRGYVEQISCLNRMLLQLVDQILARSDQPPIIILQADHGNGRIQLDPLTNETIPFEELDQDQINDRIQIFAAYHLPSGGSTVFYDSITPVNVLPTVFNYYLGTSITPLEDATYWSEYRRSYVFKRISK